MAPAQEVLKAKNYSGALALFKEAEGGPDKTPVRRLHDRNSAVRPTSAPSNFAEAAKACEEQLNDSFMTEANVPRGA